MTRVYWFIFLFEALLICACTKPGASASDAPHATVQMRDGTQATGTVVDTTPSAITVAGDDGVKRTIPMANVKIVDYGPASVAAVSPGQAAVAPDPVHANHYHPVGSAITTKSYELPAGTKVSVRNEETIDSAKAAEGQTFAAEVTKDVTDAAGDVVIPRGSNTQIVILSASKGGKFHGSSDLVLDLQSVSVDGRQYTVHTASVEERGKPGVGVNKRTGIFVGGGAAFGAIIGAIAGGGKGAGIGAASGAGAGVLTEVLTKGPAVKVPVESVLTFQLGQPLRVVAVQ
jgi:hypothetical protein